MAQTRYYRLWVTEAGGAWCIVSFTSNISDFAADCLFYHHLQQSFTRGYVESIQIDFHTYLSYTLKYFHVFQIGAFKFEVGSRDPVAMSLFFKKNICSRLTNVYQL